MPPPPVPEPAVEAGPLLLLEQEMMEELFGAEGEPLPFEKLTHISPSIEQAREEGDGSRSPIRFLATDTPAKGVLPSAAKKLFSSPLQEEGDKRKREPGPPWWGARQREGATGLSWEKKREGTQVGPRG